MTDCRSEICALASFLGVKLPSSAVKIKNNIPVITVDKNHPVEQYGTVCRYLAKKSNTKICGGNHEEEALVYQWVEYRVTHVDALSSDRDVENTLKELDSYLSDKVYMVGHRLSLADIVLYYGLHQRVASMTFYDKQKYFNLARWFNQVQHTPNLRQSLPIVKFQRNLLYGAGETH